MQNKPSTVVEYIWLGANNEIRSKTRVLYDLISNDIEEIPVWNFDGSSTNQAAGNASELIIKPQKIFMDPFKKPKSLSNSLFLIAVCDVYNIDGTHHKTNTRFLANQIFDKKLEEHPWFGIEQEYFLLDEGDFKLLSNIQKQGPYYCSNGSGKAYYRHIVEEHFYACMSAGIKICGMNAEVAPCQWEFQIGPLEGIKAADHLIAARWLLERVSEKYNMNVVWAPKPFKQLNGSGCHTNFSTEKMRQEGGLEDIIIGIEKLRESHVQHMCVYGKNNNLRMTGQHETSSYSDFSFDLSKPVDRGASVRVGTDTIHNKCGYFEDRRPASNMDPYLVTSHIFRTICLI